MSDTAVLLDYIDTQADVVPPKVGTTGYCMGGRFSLARRGPSRRASRRPPRTTAAGWSPTIPTARTDWRGR